MHLQKEIHLTSFMFCGFSFCSPIEQPPKPIGKPSIRLDGDTIVIQQDITSPSTPEPVWYTGNQPVKSGGRYVIETIKEGDVCHLIMRIPKVRLDYTWDFSSCKLISMELILTKNLRS